MITILFPLKVEGNHLGYNKESNLLVRSRMDI